MNRSGLAIGVLALVGLFVCPAAALAGPLTLTITNGRVSLSAVDVPLKQILAEWERIGGTRFVNRERVTGSLVTIELSNVSEAKAIETLLRPIAGFMAVARGAETSGASVYASVIIMPGSAAPAMARSGGGASPGMTQPQADGSGRPQVQRRVLADGRVISFVDNPNRPGDMTVVDDPDEPGNDPGAPPGMMRPPFGAPGRPGQPPGGMPGGVMPGGDPDQGDGQPAPAQAPSAVPTMPVRTLPTPGVIPPPIRPGQTPPPGPIKPPGR